MIERTGSAEGQALSVSVVGGRLSMWEDFGLPFQREVIGALEELGITNESTDNVMSAYPDLPPFQPDVPPVAAFGLEALVVGFGIYLVTKISDKAVDELLSKVYTDRVKPALLKLGARLRSRQVTGDVVLARFDHWFDGSKVLVRVCVYTKTPETADTAIVAETLRSAVNWLRTHPVTHRVLTYEVRDGRVPSEPFLSEPV